MTDHKDSVFNAQKEGKSDEKMPQGFFDFPDRALNKHEARLALHKVMERIDKDLTGSEKDESLETLLAEYGEKWFG